MSRAAPPGVEAARVVWDPDAAGRTARAGLLRARLRGVLRTALAGAVAVLLLWAERPWVALALGALAVASLVALPFPAALRAVGRFETGLGRTVGSVLAVLFLAPVFYLMLAPARLLRLGRRDRLGRRFDAAAPSYFRAHVDRSLDRPY